MNSIFSIVVLVICALFLSTSEGNRNSTTKLGFVTSSSGELLFIVLLRNVKIGVEDQEKRIVCYFESWAVYRPGKGKYDVEDIDPHLCTHGIFCFAGLNASSYKIISLDPYDDLYDDYGLGGYNCVSNYVIRSVNCNFNFVTFPLSLI